MTRPRDPPRTRRIHFKAGQVVDLSGGAGVVEAQFYFETEDRCAKIPHMLGEGNPIYIEGDSLMVKVERERTRVLGLAARIPASSTFEHAVLLAAEVGNDDG